MLKIKIYFIFIIALAIYPFTAIAQNNTGQNQTIIKQNGLNGKSTLSGGEELLKPVLAIAPREIDAGIIGSNEIGAGVFTLKNVGSGILEWSTSGPEGWEALKNQQLSSVLENNADNLRIEIRLLSDESSLNNGKSEITFYNVEMKLESGSGKIMCSKQLPAGAYREAIKITFAGGLRTIFVKFIIVSAQESALINLNPMRMDMGSLSPGKTVSKKIRVTNKGKEMLTWSVAVQKLKHGESPGNFKKGRYISFVNDEMRDSGVYTVPGHLKETMELMGKWTESDGYPSGIEGEHFIKIRFSGTGIMLYLATYPDEVNLTISLDERLIDDRKRFTDLKGKKGELLIAEGIADGPHVLTIMNKDSRIVFEGVKILGKDIVRLPAGSIAIKPNSGTTTSQTNYLNVTLNTGQMIPGYYGNNIVFNTNGGEGIVEVFVEVIPDNASKVIDIYRYSNGSDYLFTANPQAETDKRISQNDYVKEGIAFRLFKPETPGTTSFYRWYNSQKKYHFYHYDPAGGGKNLQGYIFEGSLGNIATSKLTNTRELYRWYNPATGHYFYSTDPKGGNINKQRYRFDGIAGYVR